MEYYLLDVKSTIDVNGAEVAFDYINTYFDPKKAVDEAIILSSKDNMICVSVHKWYVNEKGQHVHSDDKNCVLYLYEKKFTRLTDLTK